MAWMVGVVSGAVNLIGSFSTDGMWKTAGVPLEQFYWSRVARTRKRMSRRWFSNVCFS
jgi:hypothetical protein